MARYPLFQTRCVVSSPHTLSISLVWPGCHQVASNFLVCDNATAYASACFRLDGCVLHSHPALSLAHGGFKIMCNVTDDTGLQVGVITESMVDAESAVDTGLQAGVASVTKVETKSSFPDSPGKLRDEGSHGNYLNQPTGLQAGITTESMVDTWYMGETGLHVASNYLVCDNATVNASTCFRLDDCVLHNHPALSLAYGGFKIVCKVTDDTGLQVGVITESMVDAESAVDTGLQAGVASVTKVETKSLFPDSLGKLRDEGSHGNYLNQPTGPQAGIITESMVDTWYMGETSLQAGFSIPTKVYTKFSAPDSLSNFRDEGN